MIVTANGVDWAALLLQTLRESPLLHLDLQHTPCPRSKQLNPWQCHVLLSFLSSLVPRINAEIIDWKLCSSSSSSSSSSARQDRAPNSASSAGAELRKDGIGSGDDAAAEEGEKEEEDRRRLRDLAQIALREMLTSIRKAENYFVCHTAPRDGGSQLQLLLMAASSCDGEALCVHLHNIFCCFAGFMSVARRSLGFPDARLLSGIMEEQIRCWEDLVSRYFCLGAQALDLRRLQFLAQTDDLSCSSSSSSSPMERLLRRRLDLLLLLLLARSEAKQLEDDSILDLIKIDFEDLEGIKKRKLCGPDSDDGDDDESGHNSVVEARIGGVRVSLWRFASIPALRRRAKSLLRSVRSPFVLQLLGWSAESESHGSCTTCYLVMEAIESNLKSSIASALAVPTTRKVPSHGEGKFSTRSDPHQQLASPFPFYIALDMMLQIARGMWYLHHNGVAHGNLCSSAVWMTDPSRTPSHRQKFYDILLSDDGDPGLHTRIKLCSIAGSCDDDSVDLLHSSKFHEDVASFGHLCIEILTGTRCTARIAADESSISSGLMSGTHGDGDGDVISDDLHVPDALIECVKACCHRDPRNRPDFSSICGLLRRLKLVAYLTPVDRDLKLNAVAAMNGHIMNKGAVAASDDESVYANVEDLQAMSSYNTFALNLLEVNVKLLYSSTPAEIYAHVSHEALSTMHSGLEDRDGDGVPRTSISTRELAEMANKLGAAMAGKKESTKENGSSSNNTQRRKHVHGVLKVITSKASTLEAALVEDGFRGLLRSGWVNTTMGLGTLEMWLNIGYMAKLEWKQVAKLGLGIALCVRYASKASVSQKVGSSSGERGHCIDGFFPISPASILLNPPQLRAALLLDDDADAWDRLVQWAGFHPHLSNHGSVSIDAYATFYYGHLLNCIIRARQSQSGEPEPAALSSSEQHFESVLIDLARRCTQLECPSMGEAVAVLLDSECQNPSKASSPEIDSTQAPLLMIGQSEGHKCLEKELGLIRIVTDSQAYDRDNHKHENRPPHSISINLRLWKSVDSSLEEVKIGIHFEQNQDFKQNQELQQNHFKQNQPLKSKSLAQKMHLQTFGLFIFKCSYILY